MSRTSTPKPKPEKPYPSYPLTPHPNGQWCKKIRGKVHFFGVWADSKAALEQYNRQAGDLHAGRRPKPRSSATLSIKDLGNHYLAAQQEKAERNLITAVWFDDCLHAVRAFTQFVGKERPWDDLGPDDFARYRLHLYDRFGVCAIERSITIIRSLFKHAYDMDLVDRPFKYGGQFNKPSPKAKRLSRSQRDRANGKRLFKPAEIKSILKKAQPTLKAMILLGINGGFGNADCATLPLEAIDLKNGVIEYERPKTGVQRIVPLWRETTAALRAVLKRERPEPSKPEYGRLVFLTVFGNPWKHERIVDEDADGVPRVSRQQVISAEFRKLLQRIGLTQSGRGFYSLRHTFRTWADETHDQHAVHRIMGHSIPGMSGVYVEEISLDRLRAVVEYVHDKAFSSQ